MVKISFKHRLQCLMIGCWLLSSQAVFAQVNAALNQTTVSEGDIVTLTVTTDNDAAESPDLSAITLYFDLLNTSMRSQVSIINGQVSKQKSWEFDLQAKTKGNIIIPSIEVAGEYTKPISVQVNPLSADVKLATKQHIFVEANVGEQSEEIYVQQQIPYTIKLYYDDSMLSGNMSELQVEGAVVTQLGKEKRYRATRAGHNYLVLEKNFVISPEKSGTLVIPPLTVSGMLAIGDAPKQTGQRRFIDDFFNDQFNRSRMPRKPFNISSEAIEIDVLPIAKAFTGKTWLPAESFVIQDSWQKHLPEFTAGEPVQRTLTLQAKGLAGSQIPTLDIPAPTGMKIYLEPIESDTTTDGKAVYGNQRIKVTYIPSQAGKLTLPEIKVDFWDIINKQQRSVILPARELLILPGIDGLGSAAPIPETENGAARESTLLTDADAEQPLNEAEEPEKTSSMALLIGGVLALAFALLYGLRKYKQAIKPTKIDLHELQEKLFQACDQNNNQAAEKYLLALVRGQWQDENIHNLAALASRLATGENTLKALSQSLYSPETSQWQGAALKQLVQQGLQPKQAGEQIKEEVLKPLYPSL